MKPEQIENGTGVYGCPTEYRRKYYISRTVIFTLRMIDSISDETDYAAFSRINYSNCASGLYSTDIRDYIRRKAFARLKMVIGVV